MRKKLDYLKKNQTAQLESRLVISFFNFLNTRKDKTT